MTSDNGSSGQTSGVATRTKVHPYEAMFQSFRSRRERAETGSVVIKASELPWQQSRQGRSRYYIHIDGTGSAVQDWMVFGKEVHTESGAHTHQGGLVIYVTRGHGYSVFDGERLDWKVGDLLVLPIKPGGVEHQHFNLDPSGSSEWIGFVFLPFLHATGSILTQIKEQKGWRDE
ncbi:cupin domain-containing protein [Jiangella mangrovi]|uniref:Quercetin dioxygenase-like cupin family protein n=1 Tax=Jiangella mangrovi TaxID=1524084 RepID=A0A7W9GUB2_9ACTN|nr:cupin domain-containing protein [Jiangella mangrovi]MBB5790202.1 quercetin dioxygenase-like cupin family protein [Jiangella mangrovi]